MIYFNTQTKKEVKFKWIDLDMISEALHHYFLKPDKVFPPDKLLDLMDRIKIEMEPK